MRESWVASHGVEAQTGEVLSPSGVRVKFGIGEVTVDGQPVRAHWSNN